jgi:mRNA-degrading endonuclease RelE of RelBE toxin-antitoxin system
MEFLETPKFTDLITKYVDDESYALLQDELCSNPEAGDKIPETHGLRKIRWAASGHGKRGGARIIYFYKTDHDQIYMLYMYPKNAQSDLTKAQRKILERLVKEEWP